MKIHTAYEVLIGLPPESVPEIRRAKSPRHDYHSIAACRARARFYAQMKFEEFKLRHEAFRNSGLYDIALALKYLGRLLFLVVSLGIIVAPTSLFIYLVFWEKESVLFLLLLIFPWAAGTFSLVYIYQNRSTFFRFNKFHYSLKEWIHQMMDQ